MTIRPLDRSRRVLMWLGVGSVFLVVIGYHLYFFLLLAYYFATTPPPNWDVVVARGSDCQLKDHPPLDNHRGVVAVLREANCPGDFATGTVYNVVFVHTLGEPNTRENLAFQYAPGFEGTVESSLPKLVWKNASSLGITAPGVIDDIKVQKNEVGGVSLTYTFDRRPWLWGL